MPREREGKKPKLSTRQSARARSLVDDGRSANVTGPRIARRGSATTSASHSRAARESHLSPRGVRESLTSDTERERERGSFSSRAIFCQERERGGREDRVRCARMLRERIRIGVCVCGYRAFLDENLGERASRREARESMHSRGYIYIYVGEERMRVK